jgi:hypothetical protein
MKLIKTYAKFSIERLDGTQFTTKIGGKTNFGL